MKYFIATQEENYKYLCYPEFHDILEKHNVQNSNEIRFPMHFSLENYCHFHPEANAKELNHGFWNNVHEIIQPSDFLAMSYLPIKDDHGQEISKHYTTPNNNEWLKNKYLDAAEQLKYCQACIVLYKEDENFPFNKTDVNFFIQYLTNGTMLPEYLQEKLKQFSQAILELDCEIYQAFQQNINIYFYNVSNWSLHPDLIEHKSK